MIDENIVKAFRLIKEGDKYSYENDIIKAENCYRLASKVYENKYFKGSAYHKIGLLYYNFKKPDILYAIQYFHCALSNGYMDSSYYLATIYEYCKNVYGIDYNIDEIIRLYKLSAETTDDNNIKELSIEGIKRNEQIKLEL